ncbi:hypothetical protein OAU50_07595, partial [Planctomycetota bacterium]|nr:hypothetical protein [Planctomycetota bacterium]
FGLIGKYAEAKLLGGGVSFKGFEMKAYGPKGATHQSFDLKRPITWACDWEDDTKDSEEERERGINVQIRIAQDGKIAVLKSSIRAKRPNFLVKNMSYSAHKTLEPDEAAVALDSRKLRQVIRRLAKIVGWD